ncbi:interleukin-6-like [Acanthochromis polyacanthus]|uniref:interleukin-6-like n=1 Tax=Acanthochromis polyacanthus TaxID=80966 RepID=UPI002234C28F|nr:interleukin-6-like [Acanthochromis polyacanthus]
MFPACLPLFHSFIHALPLRADLRLLSAAVLAALMLLLPSASGAPVEDELVDNPAGDTSGEEGEEVEEELSDLQKLLQFTQRHEKEFKDEFHFDVIFLEHYKSPSFPSRCPSSNFSKEACLQRLAQGLLTFTVLLKNVETEYPDSPIIAAVRLYSGAIVTAIKEKVCLTSEHTIVTSGPQMKHRERVLALTSTQEEQLLKGLINPDTFQRKMMAHSILHHFHTFLVDAKTSLNKMEKPRGRLANRGLATISSLQQLLKR